MYPVATLDFIGAMKKIVHDGKCITQAVISPHNVKSECTSVILKPIRVPTQLCLVLATETYKLSQGQYIRHDIGVHWAYTLHHMLISAVPTAPRV